MLANRLNNFLKTRNIHYGWMMSFLVFFMTIFSAAVGSSPQILILPLNEEFNWSISDISIAIALMYLIFDTETTGLPKRWNAPLPDSDNWPRCIQIPWQIHDAKGEVIAHEDFLVRG